MRFTLVFAVGLTFATAACGGAGEKNTNGGQAGSGGAGGQDGAEAGEASCQELMTAYTNASNLAIVCDPSATNQCQQQTLSPDCTGCYRVVQDATGPDAIRAQLVALACVHPVGCPCISVGPVSCMATDGGAGIAPRPHPTDRPIVCEARAGLVIYGRATIGTW